MIKLFRFKLYETPFTSRIPSVKAIMNFKKRVVMRRSVHGLRALIHSAPISFKIKPVNGKIEQHG